MPPSEKPEKRGKKVRVPFRRNRSPRRRDINWTDEARQSDGQDVEAVQREQVVSRGDLSRQRTIKVPDEIDASPDLLRGVVTAARGLYCEVDDGRRIVSCTVRRVMRTRKIEERSAVTVGDKVRFRVEAEGGGAAPEGVIESVEPRRGVLRRIAGRRVQILAANVDQAVIVASADQPPPRPHLMDRYIVAALDGDITPVICLNKMDLDEHGLAAELAERYRALGYAVLCTSAVTDTNVDAFAEMLHNKESVICGLSGVGKSSLLNAVQPGLGLKVGDVNEQLSRGRHTTTTAALIRLDAGGYVVDTPGIRTFDLSFMDRGQFEACYVEFLPHIEHCKFADCTHRHENGCAVKDAVERGEIHPQRYDSYVHLFEEPGLMPE